MADNVGSIKISVVMNTADFEKGADKVDQKLDKTEKKSKGFGSVMSGVMAGVAASITSKLIGAVSNLTGEMLSTADASKKFYQTMGLLGESSENSAKSFTELKKFADQTIFSLEDMTKVSGNLAATGEKDYVNLAKAAGGLVAAVGGSSDAYSSLSLVIGQISGTGKLVTQDWNQITNAIGGGSALIQKQLEKNGAYTGNFREEMAKGEISAEEFNQALKEVGGSEEFQAAAKNANTFENSIGNLEAAVVSAGAELLSLASPAITGAFNALAGVVDEIAPVVKNTLGFLSENKDIFAPIAVGIGAIATAWGLWNAVVTIGNGLLTAFKVLASSNPIFLIAGIVAGLTYFFAKTESGKKIIEAVSKALGEFFNSVGKFVGKAGKSISEFFGGINNFVEGVGKGVVNFFKSISEAVGAFSASVKKFFQPMLDVFGAIMSFAVSLVQTTLALIYLPFDIIINLMKALVLFISSVVASTVGKIVEVFSMLLNKSIEIFSAIFAKLSDVFSSISLKFKQVFDAILGFVGPVVDKITSAVISAVNIITQTTGTIYTAFKNVFDKVFSVVSDIVGKIKSVITGIVDGVSLGVSKSFDFVKNLINGVIKGINSASEIINNIPGVNIKKIPALATGGITTGATLALIGEGQHDEAVIPRPQLTDLLNFAGYNGAPGGGGNVTINNDFNVTNEVDAEIISQKIRRSVGRATSGGF